jgi:hypothetical protein
LPPFGPTSADIEGDLTRICGKSSYPLNSYKTGFALFRELVRKTDDGWRLEYSPFTHLELACGSLRGIAIENAVKEKMPSRWWNRMDEREILDRLRLDTYNDVRKEIDEIETLFDSVGIIMSQFDMNRLSEVLEIAKALLGLIFLDVGDCLIYACGLVGLADEFWTSDGYLRNVITWIENPGSAPADKQAYFQEVRNGVIDELSKVISIDPAAIQLPKAYRM